MRTLILFTCDFCQNEFKRELRQTHKRRKNTFCSKNCAIKFKDKKHYGNCAQCGKETIQSNGDFKRSKNMFCSQSCSATYNNKKIPKRKPQGSCKMCKKSIRTIKRYCSQECKETAKKQKKPKIKQIKLLPVKQKKEKKKETKAKNHLLIVLSAGEKEQKKRQ